nr:TadE/TadG family type IV pilus assembly protein [Motiliproteus sp. SC1-56]
MSTSAIKRCRRLHAKQRGNIVAVTAIGMVALLAMGGLALDGGHMLLNKTRLQNTVDAAALSAAKSLSLGEDVSTARADAIATFALNAESTGNQELADAYAAGDISIVVEYSDSIHPFAPDATLTDPAFVRVTVNSFPLPVWLSQIVGFTDKEVRASAVAGESPVLQAEACDVAPIMACGEESPTDGSYYGYRPGELEVLKLGAGDATTMGPGNAQILVTDGTGGAEYREDAAGGFEGCIKVSDDPVANTEVLSEPGVKVGPTVQGFNMRIGDPSGPLDASVYKPDVITYYETPLVELVTGADGSEYMVDGAGNIIDGADASGDIVAYDASGTPVPANIYAYKEYDADVKSESCSRIGCTYDPNGTPYRRMLTLPIGKCDGTTAGRKPVEVFGFGCFFMIQKVTQKGDESQLFGQFVEDCSNFGSFVQNPTDTGTGPTRLILYKDSASGDS